jgi:transposase
VQTIAAILMSDVGLKPYTDTAYHNEALTRYRFNRVKGRAKLTQFIAKLVCILFPELEKLVPLLHMVSVYALLDEFPGAQQIAGAHLTHLKTVLHDASKGRYSRDKAIGTRMGAMILADVRDLSRFDFPDKILAYAGLSPSTYQSGQLSNCYAHMEKRGSRYLRFAIFNAAKYVRHCEPTFATYLAKKRAEGKHYNVAVSHAAKKLVRLIFALEKSGQPYSLTP